MSHRERLRVLFRFDASPEIGLGHQARCLALASCLRASVGASITVFGRTHGSTPDWLEQRTPTDDADDPAEFLRVAADVAADLVVIDRYGLTDEWFASLQGSGRRVLRLSDSPVATPRSDYLLDQCAGHSANDYGFGHPGGCELMVGARWALTSPGFFNARHLPRQPPSETPRVLIAMGGSDPTNAALEIVESVAAFPTPLSITVIAAGDRTQRAELARAAENSTHDLVVIPPTNNMAALTHKFDAAVGAGGVSALERCVVGLPAVLVPTADNQLPNVDALVAAGAAVRSGPQREELLSALQFVLGRREDMSAAARSVCDGLGVLRCARVLGAEPSVELRSATNEDKALIYGHQVLPSTRRWFRNTQAPTWSGHSDWYDSIIVNPDIDLRLIESAGFVLGQLRTDLLPDGRREVSILVTPEAQGMGVATAALQLTMAEYREPLVADIHPGNSASITAFLRAGFLRVGNREYEYGADS